MDYYPFKKFITSINDLEVIIKRVRDYRGQLEYNAGRVVTELYRGQGRDYWKLIPNIARNFTDPKKIKEIEKLIVSDFHEKLNDAGLLKSVQKQFLPGKFHSDWLLLQQAQHYKLPTRLMDWTEDWEVALFFTVSNEKDDEYDGQFWIYLVPSENRISDKGEANYLNQDPSEYNEPNFLLCSNHLSKDYLMQIAQRRKFLQRGWFCVQSYNNVIKPLEEQEQHQPYLHKVIIPSTSKKSIREELALKDITDETLFILEPESEEAISKIDAIVKGLKKVYHLKG